MVIGSPNIKTKIIPNALHVLHVHTFKKNYHPSKVGTCFVHIVPFAYFVRNIVLIITRTWLEFPPCLCESITIHSNPCIMATVVFPCSQVIAHYVFCVLQTFQIDDKQRIALYSNWLSCSDHIWVKIRI